MVKRSLQRTLSLQSAQEMTLSLCYPRVLKRGSTLSFEFASSRGTSQQIKACPLLCFTKTLWCVCELLAPFIPAAVHQYLYLYLPSLCVCAEVVRAGVCEWSLTSCPRPARVHTLTTSHLPLYMRPTPGTPYPLAPPPVYPTSCIRYAEGNPVSTSHHGDRARPPFLLHFL